MSVKPILFNTEMVRAVLDGRKTVTRRVIKPNQYDGEHPMYVKDLVDGKELMCEPWRSMVDCDIIKESYSSSCKLGDILYVRETWFNDGNRYMYRANYSESEKFYRDGKEITIKWRPSIHMPKEAARIWLKVTDVRAERLKDMKVDDAIKEGVDTSGIITKQGIIEYRVWNRMQELWNSVIKKKDLQLYGWDANPWVWVIEFERIERGKING